MSIILFYSSFALFSAALETLMAARSLCSLSSLIYESHNYLSNFQLHVCMSHRGTMLTCFIFRKLSIPGADLQRLVTTDVLVLSGNPLTPSLCVLCCFQSLRNSHSFIFSRLFIDVTVISEKTSMS